MCKIHKVCAEHTVLWYLIGCAVERRNNFAQLADQKVFSPDQRPVDAMAEVALLPHHLPFMFLQDSGVGDERSL